MIIKNKQVEEAIIMYINFLEIIERIEKLDYLISIENTGTPKELSNYLGLSERQTYRLLELMKNLNAEIEFCNIKQSYKYLKPVKFQIGFFNEEHFLKIKGKLS